MSEIKVNSIKGVGASAAAITVNNTDGTCTANLTNRTNKNLIINGAMNIAQRLGGGVATTSQGYQTVDRFQVGYSGADENLTQMQGSVSSGTTPYTLGFRNTLKITNGNQTSGAGASDYVYIDMALEGQDVAGSGWNYNSASSFITFSFWIKSSVAQSFKGYFITEDGTNYSYAFDTGSLSADTWTKVTKTISGNSNLTINNDTGRAFSFSIWPFIGTGLTDSSVTENAWITHNGSARTKDATSTWWTTNDATFEVTGFQLEVSDHATDFEHRSFADEIQRCYRYYWQSNGQLATTQPQYMIHGDFINKSTTVADCSYRYAVRMRAAPTVATTGQFKFDSQTTVNLTGLAVLYGTEIGSQLRGTTGGSLNASGGIGYSLLTTTNTDFLSFNAEL